MEFCIPTPGLHIVTGKNGSGKTTLFTCLSRIKNSNAFRTGFPASNGNDRLDFFSGYIQYEIDGECVKYSKRASGKWKANKQNDVLALMGAVDAVIEVSTTNMEKSVNNKSNRIWNFENANLDKTIEASFKQAAAIEKIGIENLPENLKETARLRVANKDLNLAQIGQLLSPPLSKSAVNHKMRKIMELANLK